VVLCDMKDKIRILSTSNARNAKLLVAGYPGRILKPITLFFLRKVFTIFKICRGKLWTCSIRCEDNESLCNDTGHDYLNVETTMR
jgi:hypothetical protein